MTNNEEIIKNLKDEQFCLEFELKTLSGIVTRGQLERWVPGFCLPITEKMHFERYLWMNNFVEGKRVLDIACGTGRGSFVLAENGKARKIVACDKDSDTIKYASIRNKHDKIQYKITDAETFDFGEFFDVIVSFETIEHLKNVEKFLKKIKSVLTKSGLFFVSTPISKKEFDNNPSNEYHLQEWGFVAFQNLISKYFDIKDIFLQLPLVKENLLKHFLRPLFKITKISNKFKIKEGLDDKNGLFSVKKWDRKKLPIREIKHRDGFQIIQCKQRLGN